MGLFQLNGISVNANTNTNVRPNYYANDDAFAKAKEATKNTPIIFGETVIADVSDKKASMRDLQARDILAKYIGGVSGFKQIMGSKLEAAFIEANKDDFVKTGTVERDGKTYDVYTFNAETSDGKISMPTLQQNEQGEQFYVMGDASYKADGTATEAKYQRTEYYQDGEASEISQYPDGRTKEYTYVYDWNLYGIYNN
ncbi:hypothetical protein IJE86_03785 [bacterium]|nr:hypothetical protein [bacterium]